MLVADAEDLRVSVGGAVARRVHVGPAGQADAVDPRHDVACQVVDRIVAEQRRYCERHAAGAHDRLLIREPERRRRDAPAVGGRRETGGHRDQWAHAVTVPPPLAARSRGGVVRRAPPRRAPEHHASSPRNCVTPPCQSGAHDLLQPLRRVPPAGSRPVPHLPLRVDRPPGARLAARRRGRLVVHRTRPRRAARLQVPQPPAARGAHRRDPGRPAGRPGARRRRRHVGADERARGAASAGSTRPSWSPAAWPRTSACRAAGCSNARVTRRRRRADHGVIASAVRASGPTRESAGMRVLVVDDVVTTGATLDGRGGGVALRRSVRRGAGGGRGDTKLPAPGRTGGLVSPPYRAVGRTCAAERSNRLENPR